jgi:hypothetical protein
MGSSADNMSAFLCDLSVLKSGFVSQRLRFVHQPAEEARGFRHPCFCGADPEAVLKTGDAHLIALSLDW